MADSVFQDRLHRNGGTTFHDDDVLQELPFDDIGSRGGPLLLFGHSFCLFVGQQRDLSTLHTLMTWTMLLRLRNENLIGEIWLWLNS
jgi:hypothetical protein